MKEISFIFAKFYKSIHNLYFVQFRPVTELTNCHGVDKCDRVDHNGPLPVNKSFLRRVNDGKSVLFQ